MSLLSRVNKTVKTEELSQEITSPVSSETSKTVASLISVKGKKDFSEGITKLHNHLIEKLEKYTDKTSEEKEELIYQFAEDFLISEDYSSLSYEDKIAITNDVKNELIGYGPITRLLEDPTVSEIMVNGPKQIFMERKGNLILSTEKFRNNEHVLQVIEKIVAPLGRRIDENMPMVDARLPDGSRVNAIIPPLALNGPTLTIRKFPSKRLTIKDLVKFGTVNEKVASFLEGCVKAKLNIFISGGTGSGKTTLLNILSSFIPNEERIITIEDAAELQLQQDHVVSLETRPASIEGTGEITIRDLVKNSLRMRPERIVIGEVRGAEALDMLQAMNTGHDGSLATGHANSPRDMLSRIETMVLMAGMELPIKVVREQISGAIQLIVQQSRLKDGTRKVTHITEVLGMEEDKIILQDIFTYEQTGILPDGKLAGEFRSTGIRPRCIEIFEHHGVPILPEWFREGW